ncbi:MAG: thioredoxin family protein [Bacteroidetes bacterium]|nr:thioredoxin family protein [Bacteroidota bacterium]
MKTFVLALMMLCFSTLNAAEGLKIGDNAIDFSLKNVDGSVVSLSSYAGDNGLVVIFTCNHCPFSKAYEDRIINLHNAYAGKGYPVLAINPNDPVSVPEDSFEKMIERSKEKGFPFKYVIDETQSIAKQYGATRTPHVYLLKKQSNSAFTVAYIGAIDDNHSDIASVSQTYLSNAIDALIAQKNPSPDFTKAIGCSIKWKK